MEPVINVVATTCPPEVEKKFNAWYDQVHVPMILKSPWVKGAARYRLVTAGDEHPKYLAIYEFENRQAFEAHSKSPELAAAVAEMQQSWKGDDMKLLWRLQYEAIKTWRK